MIKAPINWYRSPHAHGPPRAVQRRPDALPLAEGDAAQGRVVAPREGRRGRSGRLPFVVPVQLLPLTEAPRALVLVRLQGGNSTDFQKKLLSSLTQRYIHITLDSVTEKLVNFVPECLLRPPDCRTGRYKIRGSGTCRRARARTSAPSGDLYLQKSLYTYNG